MGFREARALVPYLDRLGITDLYTSPLLQARPGSAHGYDVTDPSHLNPELGDDASFDALASELAARGMGLVVDIVPNHMAAGADNPWWRSVLEHGSASPYANLFDIDWRPSHSTLDNQVLLPILGSHYGQALEAGELVLDTGEHGLVVRYFDREIPLDPVSWVPVLREAAERAARGDGVRPELVVAASSGADPVAAPEAEDGEGNGSAAAAPLSAIADRLDGLPRRTARSAAARRLRVEGCEEARNQLRHLLETDEVAAAALRSTLEGYRGTPGDPRSFDRLDHLLSSQPYALAFWRTATEEINYRRFFDIGDLISVRAEDARVFAATHGRILELVRGGKITGLRIDHIDGLLDPEAYLQQLVAQLAVGAEGGHPDGRLSGDGARGPYPAHGCYVVVEKILAPDEGLPASWPVHGTTGYDFLATVNGLFVDAAGLERLRACNAEVTGATASWEDLAFDAKQAVIRELFAGDVRSLEWRLIQLARQDRHGRDIPGRELAAAIAAVSACLSVYRTYVRGTTVSDSDRRRIDDAIAEATRRCRTIDPAALAFVRRLLLIDVAPGSTPRRRRAWLAFTQRWQQFTGPITAKGIEDTALYRDTTLVSLNEVGGEPAHGAVSVSAFHERVARRHARWPAAMSTTSTHDTKRGEDVRARIHVLSEMPTVWDRELRHWIRLNARHKPLVEGRAVPDAKEEVLIYQTMVGAWPYDAQDRAGLLPRLERYVVKALREAKRHSTWMHPDEAYEAGAVTFLRRILDPADGARFLERLASFLERIASYGAQNALSQLLLKVAAPGVADFYQGAELWNLSLVDPDNRRPVDFEKRRALLEDLDEAAAAQPAALARSLLESWRDGRIKMHLTARWLRFRRAERELFVDGDYIPLAVEGRWADNLCAFARRRGEKWVVALAPRLASRMVRPGKFAVGDVWSRTVVALPPEAPDAWRDVVTERVTRSVADRSAGRGPGRYPHQLPVRQALADLPVALLSAAL